MRPLFDLQWGIVFDNSGLLVQGLRLTLLISVVAMSLALVLGLFVALMRLSPIKPLEWIAAAYVDVFRSIPLLVFIIWVYYGIPMVIGFNFEPIVAGIIALTLQYAGWMAEIFRSGIQAIPKGQREAAQALGMGNIRTFVSIILPQAVRIVIPPSGNMFVGMLKDSSLVAVIGVYELVRSSQLLVSQTFRPFEFYTAVAIVYFVLTWLLSQAMKRLELGLSIKDPLSRGRRPLFMARRRLRQLEALQAAVGGGASQA